MSRLLAEKRDCHDRARRYPASLAARSVDAAWDVDCDDRQPPLVDRLDDRARHPLDGSREPRTKNAVDDECGAVERRRL